jgi:O-antigen/teichoic acid export membrane protein
VVLLGAQSLVSNYIASRGRLRSVLGAWLTAAALGLGLDLVVIPYGGIIAAAIVSSVSYLVVLGMHVRALLALRPESQAARR